SREGDPFPMLVETRPRRDAVHVRGHRGLIELLELLPVELDLVRDLAEHAEVPALWVESRYRPVMQHRPLLREVLAGRHSRRDLRRQLALLAEQFHQPSPAARRNILNV